MKRMLLTVLLVLLHGCGGGSAGTGGQRFDGEVVTRDGAPISNATVTITDTGDSAISDSNGRFSIDTDSVSGAVTFEIVSDDSSATTVVHDIPEDAVEIEVRIEFDKEQKEAKPTKVEIKKRNNQVSGNNSSSSSSGNSSSDDDEESSSSASSNSSEDDSDSSSSDHDVSSSSDGSSSSSFSNGSSEDDDESSSSSSDDDDDDDDDNSGSGGHGKTINSIKNMEVK